MQMEPLKQLDLLAHASENWENILFLVIMAVFWLAGALTKVLARKKGTAQQQQRPGRSPTQPARPHETWQQRIVRKAREMQQAAETERRIPEQHVRERTQATRPRPGGEISVRMDQKGDSVMVYQPPASYPERPAARPQEARQAVLAARQQITPEPSGAFVSPQVTEKPPASPPAPDEFHPLAAIDYSDPDALKNAILQYEILGKPLALREPSQEAAVF